MNNTKTDHENLFFKQNMKNKEYFYSTKYLRGKWHIFETSSTENLSQLDLFNAII